MSGIANPIAERELNSAEPLRRLLSTAGAGLCGLTIAIYQSWFMPFFLPFFTGRDELAKLVFHVLYGAVLLVPIAILATRRDVRRKVLPLAIAAAMAAAPVVLHPIGIVAKCYLITLFIGGAAIVLMLASAPLAVLRLSASVTALNAVICFLDLFFADGFTNTLGRAAGLAINPNVAAAGLLLGAAASYRAVSEQWRASFLVLVGAALLVTLSRSTLLAAFATIAAPVLVHIWLRYRHGRHFQVGRTGWRRAFLLVFVLLGAGGVAVTTNPYFRTAIDESFAGTLSAGAAFDTAVKAVDNSLDPAATVPASPPAASVAAPSPPLPRAPAVSTQPVPLEASPATEVADPSAPPSVPSASTAASALPKSNPPATAVKMKALGERLMGEGTRNSISARALFLQRGLLAYREDGFFGRGLEEAHALAPHNNFVLFAVAFGHLGWLIPLGLVGFAFYFARDPDDLPLGVALIGVMLTSHDIMVTPSLFLPVALGIGGMLAARMPTTQHDDASRSLAVGAIGGVVLFVIGCTAILFFTPPFTVERLRTDLMSAVRGGYEILLPSPEFPGLFQFADLLASSPSATPYMREDAISLRQVDWSPQARPAVHRGEYTFRQRDTLLFASSDASDPRQNGRAYEIGVPLSVSPLCYLLLGTIIAWSLVVLVSLGGRRAGRRQHL
jgi:hypothetical protein